MLTTGERHLRVVLGEYTTTLTGHTRTRPQGGSIRPAAVTGRRVLRRDRLGGLFREYAQVA